MATVIGYANYNIQNPLLPENNLLAPN
jgi:hypothetical protein